MTVHAYVLIQTDVGKAAHVAEQVETVGGVELSEAVTGPYDVIARAEEILTGKSDLIYTVAIEVVPPITLADFKTFKVEKPVAEVSEAASLAGS